MSITSVSSPLRQSNSEALSLSQQAHQYLRNSPSSIPVPFISSAESSESWAMYERLLISCLRTGNDKAAHQCLEKFVARFGATNERVMGLRGLYQEAVADDQAALEKILAEYNDVLAEDPANTVCCCPLSKIIVFMLNLPVLASIETSYHTSLWSLANCRCYQCSCGALGSFAHGH